MVSSSLTHGYSSRTREGSNHREQQQPEQNNVRQLRPNDLVQCKRHMHADVIPAAQQVSVAHDQQHGGEAEALAELLQHLVLFNLSVRESTKRG